MTLGQMLSSSVISHRKVSQFFGAPERSNFVDVLVPRTLDHESTLGAMNAAAEPLNHADALLLEQCKNWVEQLGQGATSYSLFAALIAWHQARQERAYLKTVPHVESTIVELSRAHGLTSLELMERDAPQLVQQFCTMPLALRGVIRLNLYLSGPHVEQMVCQLVDDASVDPLLHSTIARIELARMSADAVADGTFPTLIIYPVSLSTLLSDSALQSQPLGILTNWVRRRLPRTITSEHLAPQSIEYALPLGAAFTLTQGFRMYKRYLAALGCLARVYDEASGYVFLPESRQLAQLAGSDFRLQTSQPYLRSCVTSK